MGRLPGRALYQAVCRTWVPAHRFGPRQLRFHRLELERILGAPVRHRRAVESATTPACQLLLRRDGVVVNHKRIYRLYRLEGLSVRTKRRKRMVAAPRTVLLAPTRPNEAKEHGFRQ